MSNSMVMAQFLGREGKRVFAVRREPPSATHRCALIVAPFADEMNKSRRMISEVARALADRGVASILVDFYGTGDSDGEFRDGHLGEWISDIRLAADWSAAREWPVTAMLGVRLGCALGAQALKDAGLTVGRSVFWQPVENGARFLRQFLRLRIAASMMSVDARESVGELEARLRRGETVEVAGYELSASLAAQLEHIDLAASSGPHLGALHWMQVVRDAAAAPSSALQDCVNKIEARSLGVTVHQFSGDPFWSSVEIVVNPALIDRTVSVLAEP